MAAAGWLVHNGGEDWGRTEGKGERESSQKLWQLDLDSKERKKKVAGMERAIITSENRCLLRLQIV